MDAQASQPTNEELLREIQALKQRITELEAKVAVQEKKPPQVEVEVGKVILPKGQGWVECEPGQGITIVPADLNIMPYGTLDLQGCPNPNSPDDKSGVFSASWKIDIDMAKKFEDWGLAYLELEIGQGDTVEGDLSLFSNVNQNSSLTDSRVEATKFWYEQYLFNKQLALACGKFDPTDWIDENRFAHCDNTQFLGRMFKSSPSIEWPAGNAFGMRANIRLEPLNFLELGINYFEGDAD